VPTHPAHHPISPSPKQSAPPKIAVSDGTGAEAATFRSILYHAWEADGQLENQDAPDFFPDLNLDQIVDTITTGREQYDLKPFFYAILTSVEAVHYRQNCFRELLDNPRLLQLIRSFAESMGNMRAHLAISEKRYYKRQKQAAFLDGAEIYCNATSNLTDGLLSVGPASRSFQALRDFLLRYSASEDFIVLRRETEKIRADLAEVRYSLHIHQGRVTVDRNDTEGNYSEEVLQTFEKFRQADPRSHHLKVPLSTEMNHIEARILDLVAVLHSEVFAHLDEYCDRYRNYCHELITRFDREVQFYIAYLEQMEPLKKAGLSFCFPAASSHSKEIQALDAYDLALANQLIRARKDVVKNSFFLKEPERILVVSGPNQGGKTTFARTYGQLHYLAALGCPVPGVSANLFLFDRLFTHFEKEENIQNLRGKLEDELIRINEILENATANSILIMNESFLSTTMNDALFLSREVMKRIAALHMLCVTVTFLDELATFDETTVSMVSTVNPKDPQQRTFKVIRRPADGLAYAAAIAEKYHLTYDAVKERVGAGRSGVSES
jgi:DNA mismatch repair protein MutS